MKTHRIVFALVVMFVVFSAPLTFTSCSTPPSERHVEVTTLKVLGASVDASMQIAAGMLRNRQITFAQWQEIKGVHEKFQASYNIAVAAVKSDLSAVAPEDLVAMATNLSTLIQSFHAKSP
jgi:hypothetical protein